MRWFVLTAILVPTCALVLSLVYGDGLGSVSFRQFVRLGFFEGAEQAERQITDTPHWNILDHLGGNSPWLPKTRGTIGTGLDLPAGCYVDQVHMLSRHAGRYPTIKVGIGMLEFYQRIQHSNVTLKGDLAFANTWDFFTGEPSLHFENLVSTGQYAGTLEAFAAGVKLRTRYKHLLDYALERNHTSIWASDSRRVIDTARNFATAFFGADWSEIATLHIIPETLERGGDTLTPGRTCRRYRENQDAYGHAYGYRMMGAFRHTYEPAIVQRLAEQNPDFPFTEKEIFTMQQICGFETIAKGHSSWCDVFTQEEWGSFEYARDVIHYYRTGPGNPYGAAMGWLWLNATAKLLEQGPSVGSLFLAFGHDGDVVPMLNALDIFPQIPELPVTHVLHNRTWRLSDVVPMGGRIIFERVLCPKEQRCWSNEPFYPNHVYCEPQTYNVSVRVNINDGVVAIPGCDHGPGRSCPLEDLVTRIRRRGEELGSFRELCGLSDDAPERILFLHQ